MSISNTPQITPYIKATINVPNIAIYEIAIGISV
jgi:hypothetical protein